MGETRVDLLHLLEDLRDAYPGSLEETILTEVVANALDSGAALVRFLTDPQHGTLSVIDDGKGMIRRELARYHDLATSGKRRGEGIGFAGVGIKLGLLVCEEVITETRRGSVHVASSWRLASRHKAPWRWVPAAGLVELRGTATSFRVTSALSPLLDRGFVETTLRRHFAPLLHPAFAPVLHQTYPAGVRFVVNGEPLAPEVPTHDEVAIAFRIGRRRTPAALGYIRRSEAPFAEDQRGIAVSTLGKVIRRGWDWLGLTPAGADHITGLLEVPALAASLTLNKADFLRTGDRGASYLAYRRAIQEQVGAQLAAWGDIASTEPKRTRRVRPMERDLQSVLADLARDFPMLSAIVERGPGGQRRLPLAGKDEGGTRGLAPGVAGQAEATEVADGAVEPGPSPDRTDARPDQPTEKLPPVPEAPGASGAGRRAVRRPAHFTLSIKFESREGDDNLARLAESAVWINTAHPAYRRAIASRAEGYHLVVASAMALAPLAVPAAEAHRFVSSFLTRWGSVSEGRPRGSQGV